MKVFAPLFSGIAVVIDDEISTNGNAEIHKILFQLDEEKIPYKTYTELPNEEELRHTAQASFIILDWKLLPETIGEEAAIILPEGIKETNSERNITFIKQIRKYSFRPIFIFSNEHPSEIANALSKEKILLGSPEKNLIYIGSKKELLSVSQEDSDDLKNNESPLLNKINEFVHDSPQLFALKKLEIELQSAMLSLYKELGESSHHWPSILMDAFSDDGVDAEWEFRNFMIDSVVNRVNILGLKNHFPKYKKNLSLSERKEELRSILEKVRYISNSSLKDQNPAPGDLFKVDNSYWVNIRAHCDTVAHSKDDCIVLYCLRGEHKSASEFEYKEGKTKSAKGYEFSHGQLIQKINSNVVFFIDNQFAIKFTFRDFEIKKWADLKEHRVGRILPPYSDQLQQRFAFYIKRKGVQVVPKEMFIMEQE